MTGRDRTVAMVIGALAVVAAFWFLALGPKRSDSKALADKVTAAQQRLDAANQSAAAATAARDRYDQDYAAVAKLGKAVPADDDVASLVYQLDTAAKGAHIDFRSIKLDSSGAPAPAPAPPAAQAAAAGAAANGDTSSQPAGAAPAVPATQTAAAGLPPGSSVGSAGFPTMPFAFEFDGSFFAMERFFNTVQRFATLKGADGLSVRGRLLTVDAFALSASRDGFPRVKATINATTYLVPQDEGVTAGATPQGPAGATPAAAAGAPAGASPAAPAAATSIAGGAR